MLLSKIASLNVFIDVESVIWGKPFPGLFATSCNVWRHLFDVIRVTASGMNENME